jgi:proline dehydrogenase
MPGPLPTAHLRAVPTRELLRAWLVFRACAFPPLVARARPLLAAGAAVLGTRAVNAALRGTFFAHFCGGETLAELAPRVAALKARGVGASLLEDG